MTVSELIPLYLRYCQVERFVAPASLEKYAGCCRVWILPNFGGVAVEDVGRPDISRLRERMSDQGLSFISLPTPFAASFANVFALSE
jgi:hypothetical protein